MHLYIIYNVLQLYIVVYLRNERRRPEGTKVFERLQYNLVEEVVTERQTQDGVYCREVYIELG